MSQFTRWFDEISIKDIPLVGGKNASLGEMYRTLGQKGIRIPPGFAISADAFTALIGQKDLGQKIYHLLSDLNPRDTAHLARVGNEVRSLVKGAGLPEVVAQEIRESYRTLCKKVGVEDLDVAVRSSATAEDLPDASFAGQQETFLNIRGEEPLLVACLNCFASLFTDRAISYRHNKGFAHEKVRLSVGVQQMVRSDLSCSGVIFTLDTETGARNVVLLTSSYGLGENVVAGRVDPDEFMVSKALLGKAPLPILRKTLGAKQLKMVYSGHGSRTTKNIDVSELERSRFSISNQDVIQLAEWAVAIEQYYSDINQRDTPMDIEWGKDGRTGELFILQARPETVHSSATSVQSSNFVLRERSEVLCRGRAVGAKIGAGKVRYVSDVSQLSKFQPGEVLVTDMTDPDWEPVMKKAAAIVTNRGGRTCHAAIVSREHGVPCIVGTGRATTILSDGQEVTVSCAEGNDGFVYQGVLKFEEEKIDWQELGNPQVKVMVNLGNPGQALKNSLLPVAGVGLVRIEFIISESVRVHPMALAHPEKVESAEVSNEISKLLGNYKDNPSQFFVDKLAEGIGMIAGAFYPRPVIVRLSDFKSNEYASLLGGRPFEPQEENPMIGFRGASRYYDPRYRDGFALECKTIKFLREEVGLKNIKVMVPFCRSPEEGKKVLEEMNRNGLVRGKDGLEVYVMSELPTNALRGKDFAEVFDGFSIGSNDLTQMVLGVDRDSEVISHLFDERDPAVKEMLRLCINSARAAAKPIGICGQAPGDYPELCRFLIDAGINSISVTPDSVLRTIQIVLESESKRSKRD